MYFFNKGRKEEIKKKKCYKSEKLTAGTKEGEMFFFKNGNCEKFSKKTWETMTREDEIKWQNKKTKKGRKKRKKKQMRNINWKEWREKKIKR